MACCSRWWVVFLHDALDQTPPGAEVQGAFDYWISLILTLSRMRKACYAPERLPKYRIHRSTETVRAALGKLDNVCFIYRRAPERRMLRGYSHELRARAHEAYWRSGLIYLDKARKAADE